MTATRWKVRPVLVEKAPPDGDGDIYEYFVVGPHGGQIASCIEHADAARIVREHHAVPVLVEALELARIGIESSKEVMDNIGGNVLPAIKAALAGRKKHG